MRAAYVDFLSTGPLRWRKQALEEAAVALVGDTAVLHGIVVDDLRISGDPHVLRFATTQTYVRVSDRWYYAAPRVVGLPCRAMHAPTVATSSVRWALIRAANRPIVPLPDGVDVSHRLRKLLQRVWLVVSPCRLRPA